MAYVANRLDEIGRPAWIALTILGFWFWWPVGLAILAYLAFSRRERRHAHGRWEFPAMRNRGRGGVSFTPASGNGAFDDFRWESLRLLEDDEREFVEYLERLRQARDKQEFDQFMADRRRRPEPAMDEVTPA